MKKIIAMLCVALLAMSIFTITGFSADSNESLILLGDSDLDERVNIKDATAIQKHLAGIATLSDKGLLAADADCNGTINIKDATVIQKFIAGYKFEYPIGEPIITEDTAPSEPDITPDENTSPDEPVTPSEPDSVTPSTPDVPEFAPVDGDLSDPVTQEVLWKIEKGFLRLVNEERARLGIHPLTHHKHLDDAAQIRSAEIIDSYSHTRPNGESFNSLLDITEYPYITAGENINMSSHVLGFFNPAKDKFIGSEEQIESVSALLYEGFKNSPGHYANMIDADYKHTGIGISYTYDAEWGLPYFYISHIFGSDS